VAAALGDFIEEMAKERPNKNPKVVGDAGAKERPSKNPKVVGDAGAKDPNKNTKVAGDAGAEAVVVFFLPSKTRIALNVHWSSSEHSSCESSFPRTIVNL